MSLADFPRHPLTVRAEPDPSDWSGCPTTSAAAPRIWAKREDCNSGPRLRRQQDPQAGVPGPRRARPGRRHAGVHRRRAVQPHPAGRRRRRPPRAEGCSGAGAAGSTGRTRSTTGSATSCCRGSWAPRCGSTDAGFGIGFQPSWEQALDDVEASAAVRRTPIPAGASDHPLGGLGFANWADEVAAAGGANSASSSTPSWCAGDRIDPGRDDRRLRRSGPTPPGPRHRRVREARRRPATRWRGSPRNTAELIGLGRDLRDDEITAAGGLGGRPLRHPGASRRSTRSGLPAGWRA